jgi:hypothetical protein
VEQTIKLCSNVCSQRFDKKTGVRKKRSSQGPNRQSLVVATTWDNILIFFLPREKQEDLILSDIHTERFTVLLVVVVKISVVVVVAIAIQDSLFGFFDLSRRGFISNGNFL